MPSGAMCNCGSGVQQAEDRETTRCNHEDPASSKQTANINGKGTDKHECHVVGASDPGAIIETDTQASLEVGRTESEHAAGQRNDTSTHNDAQDPKQWTL